MKVEKIVVTGGASRRPYGNWVVYVAFAVMAEMEMLAVDKKKIVQSDSEVGGLRGSDRLWRAFLIRAAGASTILHSSFFIIH